MKRFLIIFILLLFGSSSQSQECVTEPTQSQLDYLQSTSVARQNWSQPESIIWLPIQNHIVRENNGSGGLSTSNLSSALSVLNGYYMNANIQFYECNSVNYIDNSNYYNFSSSQESALCNANDVPNVINVYYFNSVTSSSGGSLCGYAYFPGGSWKNRIIMRNSCALNGSTLTHEFGHYLSLYHTHGTSNNGTTNELVNGSNCSWAGDELCDTPADPNLSGSVNSSCQYTGTAIDPNGQAYVPDPTNIMSYSLKPCRTSMSSGQYNRMNYSAINDRNYLTCSTVILGCTDPTAANYNPNATINNGSCIYSSPINISANISNVSCYGESNGSISLTVNGGMSPYTYSWSNGSASQNINSLSTGTYTVMVVDNLGQTQSSSFIITQPTPLITSLTINHPSFSGANDGSIYVSPSGGTPPYIFYWTPYSTAQNLTNLASGLYILYVVDDNGCFTLDSILLENPVLSPLSITGSVTHLSCNGDNNGMIDLSVSGGVAPYNFLWSNGSTTEDINNLSGGIYSVNVTDAANQTTSMSFTIIEPDSISISYTVTNASGVGYNDGAINTIIAGGTPPYFYYWNTNPSQNTQNISNLAAGIYTLWVVDANSCYNSVIITVNENVVTSCGGVTGVYLSDIIHTRAVFNWDNMNSSICQVDQIRIRYRPVGISSWMTKTMGAPVGNGCNVSNTSKLVRSLIPSTQYEYEFKIWYCNTSIVNWHSYGTFTTLPDCENAINLTAIPLSPTKTEFCWDSVSTYSFVRLKYREDVPGSTFISIGGFGVFSPSLCKQKNSITPGLNYRVKWKTYCSPNGGPYRGSQWDGPVLWTQPSLIRFESSKFNKERTLIRITDLLGREVYPYEVINYTTLFYIYTDGIVEKRIIIE